MLTLRGVYRRARNVDSFHVLALSLILLGWLLGEALSAGLLGFGSDAREERRLEEAFCSRLVEQLTRGEITLLEYAGTDCSYSEAAKALRLQTEQRSP